MKKKTKVAAVALGTAAVLTLGASLAYFTDRADSTASGRAGTVDIEVEDDIELTDEEGKNILNPGDERSVKFNLTNKGNKSIDVRETIVLQAFESDGTTPKALTDVNGQAQYELYSINDVEINYPTGYAGTQATRPDPTNPNAANYAADLAAFKADGRTYGYRPISGKTPLVYRDATAEANGKITYYVGSSDGTWNNNQKSYTLNGSTTEGVSAGINFNKAEFDANYTSQVTVAGAQSSVTQTGEPVKMDGETFASFTARKAAYEIALNTAIGNYMSTAPEGDTREIEDGINTIQHADDYVLVFRGDSANDWQDTVVRLDYLAEAKQHRNTGEGWATVEKKTVQFGQNGTKVVVPAVSEDNTVEDLTTP